MLQGCRRRLINIIEDHAGMEQTASLVISTSTNIRNLTIQRKTKELLCELVAARYTLDVNFLCSCLFLFHKHEPGFRKSARYTYTANELQTVVDKNVEMYYTTSFHHDYPYK